MRYNVSEPAALQFGKYAFAFQDIQPQLANSISMWSLFFFSLFSCILLFRKVFWIL